MILKLPCHYYLASIGEIANQNISMERLLKPFKIAASKEEDGSMLLGFVTDIVAETFRPGDSVDPFELAGIAWELGFDPALDFLENGPLQIYQLLKEVGALSLSP